MKNRAPILAFIFFVAFAASCASKPSGDTALHIAIPAGPMTLDPRIASDAEGDKISALICDGLMKKDDSLDIVPAIAERIEVVSDTSYRFFLRPDVKFSDGTPLTAEDVIYTYRSMTNGTVKSQYKSAFERIAKMEAESPLVLRIELKEPYAPFFVSLTRGIVSKSAAKKLGDAFGQAPVCAGAYKVARFAPDTAVELSASENYYGTVPAAKRIEFQIIMDDNIRVLKLIKGDVDIVQNAIPPMLLDSVMKNRSLSMLEDTGIVMAYMGFNLTDRLLAKRAVREAIAYAIDRDELISHRWKGLAVKANSILAPGNWAYDPSLMQYPYDPNKAMRILDEAGLKDPDGAGPKPRFAIALKTSTKKDRIDTLRMIAHQLAKVGIEAKVEPYEWGKLFQDIKNGNFQAYTLTWVGVIDPDIFYDICQSQQTPPNGLNRGRYKNAEVDRLVTEGRRELDRERRKEIYAKVQELLLIDLPFVPLWYEKNVVVFRGGLKNVRLRPDASYAVLMDVEKD